MSTSALVADKDAGQESTSARTSGSLSDAEKLALLETEYRQFVRSVSHDLQAPLRAVAGFSSRLSQEAGGKLSAEERRCLGVVMDGAARMQVMLRGLVELSRVRDEQAGSQPVLVSEMVQRAVATLAVEDAASVPSVTWDALPTIRTDPTRLQTVFEELIRNASRFCEAATPVVHIAARRLKREAELPPGGAAARHAPPGWLFSVRDNGIGISPQSAQVIFQPFKRLHPYGDYPGVGLGLTLVQRIVYESGGTIWHCGQTRPGSCFKFLLPD